MKNYIKIAVLLLLALAFNACKSKKPEEMLVGTWQFDTAAMNQALDEALKTQEWGAEQKMLIEMLKMQTLDGLQKATLTFEPKGFLWQNEGASLKGQWAISEDNKSILLTFQLPQQTYTQKLDIEEISEKKLILFVIDDAPNTQTTPDSTDKQAPFQLNLPTNRWVLTPKQQ
ncbi:hypothetical protein [Eisenibacter elegans]|jgi:hypothetical protein|uniref:hypothetical protein n=1 Tax=Eisenibacter elegans TaxID=997 RepID=UPI0004154563|nr:hypothetical protein [Eisenibacter elegans]